MGIVERILRLDPYEASDTDTAPETIADTLANDPAAVVKYLLDIIDDLQA